MSSTHIRCMFLQYDTYTYVQYVCTDTYNKLLSLFSPNTPYQPRSEIPTRKVDAQIDQSEYGLLVSKR